MSQAPQRIRLRTQRGPRLGICLIAFLLGGGVSAYVGYAKLGHQQYTSQAQVCYEFPGIAGPPPLGTLPSLAEAEQQILEPASLTEAWHFASSEGGKKMLSEAELGQLRHRIRIVGEGSPQRPVLTFHYLDDDAARAVRFVNHLAERYAAGQRARWTDVSRSYQDTRQATEQARREYQEATTRLAAFQKQQDEAAIHSSDSPRQPDLSPAPAMVDNPAWLDLDRQLATLSQRRSQLLIDRTPAHPEVQYVEAQIDALREAQAKVPRQIPNPTGQREAPSTPPATTLGHILSPANVAERAQAAAQLATLHVAVEQAKQKLDQLTQAERRAWQRQQAAPQIAVQLASHSQVAGKLPGFSSRLAGIALGGGVLPAIITGLLTVGWRRDRPVSALAEVQSLMPVPIVGVISLAGPEHWRRRSLSGGSK